MANPKRPPPPAAFLREIVAAGPSPLRTFVERFVERVHEIGREHDELARRDGVELCDDELERDVDGRRGRPGETMMRGARVNVECTACPWASVRARDTCTADDCPKCHAPVRRVADKPVAPRGLRDEERARKRLERRRELRRKSPAAGAEVVQHADEPTGERLE